MNRRFILRGYGPLIGVLIAFFLVTTLVPSRPYPKPQSVATFGPGAGSGVEFATGTETGGDVAFAPPAGGTGASGSPAAAGGAGGAGGAVPGGRSTVTTGILGNRPGQTAGATAPGDTATSAAGATGVAPGAPTPSGGPACGGSTLQDQNTLYSPPCARWTGTDNGGATSRGVTKEEIVVSIREGSEQREQNNNQDDEFEKKARERGLTDTKEDRLRTRDALLEYFNARYQTYGRKVKLVTFKGRGNLLKEFGGGGQEEANADALQAGQEIGAFADLSANTQPYLDALVRQKVVAFGGLHLPTSYYQARAPYAWGQLVDCTSLLESGVDLIAKRYKPGTNATRAGSRAIRNQPRRYGLLVPDDPIYKTCLNDARPRLQAAGIEFTKEIRYGLDFSKMQQEAPNIVAQLKEAGVTSVVLFTDPALPYFMTGAATQQNYWPEWVVTGTVATDMDVVGQFYDQDQWQFAAGQSFLSDIYQGEQSESYRAYKAVRQDEPAISRDQYYYQFLMLFIAIQMAGPNLTPETFQGGLFSYPPRNGASGRWSFSPTDYTAIDDAREIYYDRNALSAFNNKSGRYIALHGGRRFRGATWPAEATIPVPPAAAP